MRPRGEYQSVKYVFVQGLAISPPASLNASGDGQPCYESFCETVSQLLQLETSRMETGSRRDNISIGTHDLGNESISTHSEDSTTDHDLGPSLGPVARATALKSSSQTIPDTMEQSPFGSYPSSFLTEEIKVDDLDPGSFVALLAPPFAPRKSSDASNSDSSARTMTSGESTTTTTVSEYGGGAGGEATENFSPIAVEVCQEEAIMDVLEVLSFSDESTTLSLATSPNLHQSFAASEGFSHEVVDNNMEEFLGGSSVVIGDSDFCPVPLHYQAACRARSRLSTVSSTASSAVSTVDSVISSSSTAKPVRRHQKITHKLSQVVDRVSDHLSSSRVRRSHSSHRSSTSSATGSKRHSELFRESLASKRDSILDQYAEL